MDFKKLNEELQKYLSINEISDDLKQRYINGRKKQLADLKAQFDDNPLIKASNLSSEKRNRVNKMYSRNSISNDKYLIGKFNDINFYVAYKINEYSHNAVLLIERNGEILNRMTTITDTLEEIVRYYLTTELLDLLANYIKQGKIKSSKDIQIQVPSSTIQNMPFQLDRRIIRDEFGTNIDWVSDFIKNLKPDRKLDKLVQELSQTVFSESFELNELNSSTLKNYKKKVEDDYQKSIDDYWKLRDDDELNKQRDELANKINRLEKKIAAGQDMIQGNNTQKRILGRGTWIVDVFKELDQITEQIKNNYKQFSIKMEKELKDQRYKITIDIPTPENKSCSIVIKLWINEKTTQNWYHVISVYDVYSDNISNNIQKQLKRIFNYFKLSQKKFFYEPDLFKWYQQSLSNALQNTLDFLPTVQKRLNRAPRQEANYITLFKEKSQWGLDIQLKEMSKGYQVISHVGGYDADGYDPDMETDTMSGLSKNWRKAIDQAVKTCIEEDDLIDDLLYAGEMYDAFGDNEYAEYFLSELQKVYDEQNPEDEE